MHRKNIRQIVIKQLKSNHPYWKKMTKKSKKELAKQVMDEIVGNYDYSQSLDLPIEKLTGIEEQTPETAPLNQLALNQGPLHLIPDIFSQCHFFSNHPKKP